MNTIAITGHTSGIGLAVQRKFERNGWNILGFSKSNGFNIKDSIEAIVDKSKNVDVFVNNAYNGYAQVDLLFRLFDLWKNESKIIINISSNSPDTFKSSPQQYAIHKAALDGAIKQLQGILDTKCKIINIRPGYVDTPRVSFVNAKKIDPLDIADLVFSTVKNADRYIIQNITLVPNND